MIDRRSMTDHPSLSGTDFVLEGASVRDRFLTAFVLQHNGALEIAWPQEARLHAPPSSGSLRIPLLAAVEESYDGLDEDTCEPLMIRMVDGWLGADDDEDDM